MITCADIFADAVRCDLVLSVIVSAKQDIIHLVDFDVPCACACMLRVPLLLHVHDCTTTEMYMCKNVDQNDSADLASSLTATVLSLAMIHLHVY